MQDLRDLETKTLMEMLVQQTELYTSKITEKDSVSLQQHEYDIALIQSELNSRQVAKSAESAPASETDME